MNINTAIPAPSSEEQSNPPIGYDIPRDTISREFIKSAKTARQLSSQHSRDEGFRQHLMPSPSPTSSLSKLVGDTPRIIISSPDDDIPPLQLRCDLKALSPNNGDAHELKTASIHANHRSYFKAIVLATVVLIVVVFLLVILVFA